MICKHILWITILNKPELILLQTVKWFQVLLYNSHNLISIICLHTVCFIWLIDGTLSDGPTPGQSEPESDGNEGAPHILPISQAGHLSSDGLISYLRHLVVMVGGYPFAEMQSVYSIAPTNLAWVFRTYLFAPS